MSILSNYIFKQIGSYFIYITIFFISLIWLILSLKFIEYVTANGLDFKDFIKMTSLLLPTVIPTLTPLTLSLACIFVYNKLSNDNELIIIKSSGFSALKILKPAILLSLIIALFNLFLNLYFSPLSKSVFKENQKNLREDIARIAFKAGSFSNLNQDITIYIEKIIDKNNYEHVFVYDSRNKKDPATYIAKEAELVQIDDINKVILKKGNRQIIDKKSSQLSLGFYDTQYKYSADYDLFYKMIVKKKMLGISTRKEEVLGKFRSGGLSSRIKYLDFLKENNRIRINNGQNVFFVYLIFILRLIRNFKNIF